MRSLHRKLQKTKFNLRLNTRIARTFQYYLQQLNKKSATTIYYDPGDLSRLYQNTSATTPVTALEQTVGVMLNQFGDNKHSVRLDNVAGTGVGLAANPNLNLTGDFTVECFIRIRALPTTNAWQTGAGGYQGIWSTGANSSGNGTTFFFGTTNIVYSTPNDSTVVINTPHNFQTNVWHHVALTREGQVYRLFIDGVLKQQVTSAAATYLNEKWGIARGEPVGYFSGGWLNGDISNFRAIKGTAVYTSNFTVPTQNLEPIPGTVVLCCGVQWSGNPVIEQGVSTYIIQETPFGNGDGTYALAIPGNNTNLPVLSRRINLLNNSEDFSGLNSTVSAGKWITEANPLSSLGPLVTAPDGTLTARTITFVSNSVCYQRLPEGATPGVPYHFKCWLRKSAVNGANAIRITSNNSVAWNTGQSQKIALTNDWTEYSFNMVLSNNSTVNFGFDTRDASGVADADCVGAVDIWHPDLRHTIFANLPYQRRTSATNYDWDPNKFPTYLRMDGSNDGMRTGTLDLSDFNKVFVSMAMAKLSNSAASIVQAGSDGGVTDGSFALTSNERSLEQYAFKSKGTIASAIANTSSNNAAPHAGVITASADIEANAMSLDIT